MQMICYTDRLILKVLNQNDANKVLDFYIRNKDFFEEFEPRTSNFYTLAFQKAALSYENSLMIKSKALRYYVFEQCNPDKIIGTVSFSNIIRGSFMSCQLGYKFDQLFLRRGYATEALDQCIYIIFHDYKLHRIEAYIKPSNLPSIHLIEKFGFQYEGIAYQSIKIRDKWEDHFRYARINNAKN